MGYGSGEYITNQERLQNTRDHARNIQRMLDSGVPDDKQVRLSRALYETDGYLCAATIGQQAGTYPYAQVQLRFFVDVSGPEAPPTTQTITGRAITATEMAVFLGLDEVDPTHLTWVDQFLEAPHNLVAADLPERETVDGSLLVDNSVITGDTLVGGVTAANGG